MLTFILGQIMGFPPVVVLPLSIAEGVAVTILLSWLSERYLFPIRHR